MCKPTEDLGRLEIAPRIKVIIRLIIVGRLLNAIPMNVFLLPVFVCACVYICSI